MHKYKNNEITILRYTICSSIFYFINYIQVFNLNKKIINITEFLDFITIFIRICQKNDDITTYSQINFTKI